VKQNILEALQIADQSAPLIQNVQAIEHAINSSAEILVKEHVVKMPTVKSSIIIQFVVVKVVIQEIHLLDVCLLRGWKTSHSVLLILVNPRHVVFTLNVELLVILHHVPV
jgi:hypothetical protein